MSKIKFYDENTRQWWTPNTGGANIPSLNDLLSPWGISLTDEVLEGEVWLGGAESVLYYASGVGIHSFPDNGFVVSAQELNDQGEYVNYVCCEVTDNSITGLYVSFHGVHGCLVVHEIFSSKMIICLLYKYANRLFMTDPWE